MLPQRSVFGPIMWIIYIDDLFQQLSTVAAYADNFTHSRSYCCLDRQLSLVEVWEECGRSALLRKKCRQWSSHGPQLPLKPSQDFGSKSLPLKIHTKILGVAIDLCLWFDHQVSAVALQTSQRVCPM